MASNKFTWSACVTLTQEDEALVHLVNDKGEKKWCTIASLINQQFGGSEKSGKQCRERWHNHLNPTLNKESFSLEDEIKVFEYQKQYGNKWSIIAEHFEGRNDNFIKNCFYSAIRRNLRKYNKKKVPSKQLKGTVSSLMRNPQTRKILMNFPEHENFDFNTIEAKVVKEARVVKEDKVVKEAKVLKSLRQAKVTRGLKGLQDSNSNKTDKGRLIDEEFAAGECKRLAGDENAGSFVSSQRKRMNFKHNLRIEVAKKQQIKIQRNIGDITPTLFAAYSLGMHAEGCGELDNFSVSTPIDFYWVDRTESLSTTPLPPEMTLQSNYYFLPSMNQ